ncbi:hypothetical protein RHSIM_RhsimUnG0044800 [Rhododendron simsii]|uniref:Tetratricopeptide repeat (TPR)-like superfamily protein n=1 Tax=Rhododendron simsii TaxID=118357 RepID=A0A834FW31_RHOSS|nr:hypothetical protein RHSIM_RhsimUnG0044800 [Rhododendron simsii]
MKTLISHTLTHHLSPQFSHPNFIFHFPSVSRENSSSLNFPQKKWIFHPKTLTFCLASEPLSYGGWDDPVLVGGPANSGESNQLRNLLNSLGIDDKKYIFVYVLGFICALAITRIRVSSIVVIPACVVVFAVGFSIGFVNGGHGNELSLNGTKKRPKDEISRVSIEKLRNLVDLFSGFDGKISNLKSDVRSSIESSHVTVGDLEGYVKVMESIGLCASNARSSVEACIDSISVENQEFERTLNQKSVRRKKEASESGFDLWQFVSGVFKGKSVASKANKTKDIAKRDSTDAELNDRIRGNILAPRVEDEVLNSVPHYKRGTRSATFSGERRINVLVRHDEMSISDMGSRAKRVLDNEQFSYQNRRLQFVNNKKILLRTGNQNEVETWESPDNFRDFNNLSGDLEHMEAEALFEQEQILHKTNGSYSPSPRRENREKDTYKPYSREEYEKNEVQHLPSSVSNDIEFNRYLMEANDLLKEARECLRVKGDEEIAETVLYKSANLLSEAIDMKPMSLLAVGQLGNTYLLHGELKLKISRQLRVLLANNHPKSVQKHRKVQNGLDDEVESKDQIASALVNVCEECEELLVEAGRKYKLALTIDGNDMRALYNWGLALSFRAQLIADIGPEVAFDADKIFLAAIDKFDAMMSKSNVYAPDALFRWGVALQQRSRLRPRNSKEKVKLLQQAKRLFEDALDMDSDNPQVREAISSCTSELSFRSY